MRSADLAGVQQAFSLALFEQEAVPQALPLFKGDAGLNERRLALYRGNQIANWGKTLAAAYPVIQALVGEEFFEGLAREYGKAYPSQIGDLNYFGAHFPEFLADFTHVADYPYFPDVAALEWAVHRAHYAANAQALPIERFAQLEPEALDRAHLALHPACTLIASQWALTDIWFAHQTKSEHALPERIDMPSFALVVRPHWKADVLALTASAYAALSSLSQGQPLGTALDTALDVEENFDFGKHLQQWLQNSVLVELQFS